jgi:hypothetical protein
MVGMDRRIGRIDEWMRWIMEGLVGWRDGRVDEMSGGWMDGWMDEMDGMDRWMGRVEVAVSAEPVAVCVVYSEMA